MRERLDFSGLKIRVNGLPGSRFVKVIISRVLPLKIADSRVPFIITIPHLAPLFLQIPGSRPSDKPNPGSRKTYRGPSP